MYCRYKCLLCLKDLPPVDGESCVIMLHKLGPVKKGSYQLGVSKVSSLSNTHMYKIRPNESYIRNKYGLIWIHVFVHVLDFPERGAVSAVGGKARPRAEHGCHDAAEIHPHLFCAKELYQVPPTCDPV